VYSGTANFEIGRRAGCSPIGCNFGGRIDEVGLWKRVLTPEERSALYNAGAGRTYGAELALPILPTTIKTYYYAGGLRIAERVITSTLATSALYYLHGDHLGSTSLMTCGSGCGTAGAVVARQLYYPFGQVRYITGTLQTDFGFTGQLADDTGLMFYNARYYDVVLGRFVSADTIVFNAFRPQSLNRYSYSINNPLRYIDPSGHVCYDPQTDAARPGNCGGTNSPRPKSYLPSSTNPIAADRENENAAITTYNEVVRRLGYSPNAAELAALTAQAEWGSLLAGYSQWVKDSMEAKARTYVWACGTNDGSCGPAGILKFLMQFAVWWNNAVDDFFGTGADNYRRFIADAYDLSSISVATPALDDHPFVFGNISSGGVFPTMESKLGSLKPSTNGWYYYNGSSATNDVWLGIRYLDENGNAVWALLVTPGQRRDFCQWTGCRQSN
jgi:RHS repeat-associated protein